MQQIINIYNEKSKYPIGLTTLLPHELKEPEEIEPLSVIIFDDVLTDPR